jgi:hypothetical protein
MLSWIVLALFAAQSGMAATAASSQSPANLHRATIDEMLLDAGGRRQYWQSTPGLVVITSVLQYRSPAVLQYRSPASEEYVATADAMTPAESKELVADLTFGLQLLTDGAFEQFANIKYETAIAGSPVAIVRPNQVVVGRFQGVKDLANTIGFGGRKARRNGAIVGGTIVLDNDFDRTSDRKRLLRTHELGHALGFNHVHSRVSIMNPRVGPGVNEIDRQIARVAFTPAVSPHAP